MQLNIKNQFINVNEMELLELIIGNFIGFGFALILYVITKYLLEFRLQNNFLSLIKDEIIFNKQALELILKMDFTEGETALRLKTENKDGCWSRIIEFRHKNSELIGEISLLYTLFQAIVFALDFKPYYVEDEDFLKNFNKDKMKAIKGFSEGKNACLNQIDRVIQLIDKELNKNIWS